MPTFVITDGQKGVALKVAPGLNLLWVIDFKDANTYPSKYAAKRHLKQLDNIPEDIKIVELVVAPFIEKSKDILNV